MVVFQNYSLHLDDRFENIYLGIDSVWPEKPKSEKVAIVKEHLELVGLSDAASKSQRNYPEA